MSKLVNEEIAKLFPLWRHEGLAPLTTIVGYANLLLDSQAENLTDQQKHFLTLIRNAALKGYSSWNNPGEYIKLIFEPEHINWQWKPVQLGDVCDTILASSFKYINKSNVHVSVSTELPPVRADRAWLSIAIANLLEPSVGYVYNAEFEPSISALEEGGKFVLLKVSSGLQISLDEQHTSIEAISFPGSNLSVANVILSHHGSQLQFRRLKNEHEEHRDQGTEFEFMLPMWQ